jgi:Spy/CpxP family protein refolding chaperone
MRRWLRVGRMTVLSLALAPFGVSAAGAQGRDWSPPSPEQMVEEHLTRMTEDLGLTDEQVMRVRPIIEEHVAKMRTLMDKRRQQGRDPGGSGREQTEGLRKQLEERLETVLTQEQMKTYREKQQERRERRRGRAERRGGGRRW